LKRCLLIAFIAGVALLAAGYPWGGALVVIVVFTVTFGVVRMQSGILGPVRTTVDKGIALTYDDGPDPASTPALLDLLKAHNVKATFFVIGEKVRAHPEIVRRCHDEGHTVGNHSHRHGIWTNLHFGPWMRREIGECQNAVEQAIGVPPRYYRPPFGLMNPHVEPAARSHGLEVVGWTIRSLDTSRADAVERVVDLMEPGAIVLLHDGDMECERVVATTRAILEAANEQGLEPVAL